MDISFFFSTLISAFSHIPYYSWAAITTAIFISWISSKSVRHFCKIRKADLVIKRLQSLAVNSGPAAQFHYLRSRAVDPFAFEEAILSALKKRGFTIKRNRRYTGDGGIDGLAWWEGKQILIQAKLYSGHISAAHVQEFSRLCAKRRAHGLFVHSGRTGAASKSQTSPVLDIVSGERLLKFLTGDSIILFPHGAKIIS